ncbi:MAG TPA: tetratricopeptide repeat protein [Kofleriaceae bacterium]|jgi:tetratricopeptide (TPR) repeat protein
MRLLRRAHVAACVLLGAAGAHAAVPDYSAGPPTVAVTPFENHVPNGASMQWMVAEAPFEIAEKSETVLGLEAIDPPLYVGGETVPAEPDTVAAFGRPLHATFVVTGWFDKVGDDLRVDVVIWKLGATAAIAGEAQQRGAMPTYHQIVGDALAEAWTKAGVAVDDAARARLVRNLATDIYPVFMTGRGLGYLTGATGKVDLKAAEHDLERAVFLDPKLFEAQRLLGELYLREAPNDPRAAAKASAKFNYAVDLAPDDVPALRAAAMATAQQQKWEPALELFTRLVRLRPWDLDARFELGQAMWQLGDAANAQRQLEQVTEHAPDDLRARRVLVLIHASRGDSKQLASELEAIAVRAPDDLEVKSDLATAYGALGDWPKAIAALESIAKVRGNDAALAMRIGDAHRANRDLDGALAWYGRAQQLSPGSSMPGFVIAQAQFDAGRLADANRTFTNLQKFAGDLAAAEHDLGVIALVQNRGDDAAWYLRKAVREGPRVLATRRAAVAAELLRKDSAAALDQLAAAQHGWPDDPVLAYLAGVAHALANNAAAARADFEHALDKAKGYTQAQAALTALDAGAPVVLDFAPELVRPWGDRDALGAMLDHFDASSRELTKIRASYQGELVTMLGLVGKGPGAPAQKSVGSCALAAIAPAWSRAQADLARYDRVGEELETAYRFIAKHDELGLTAGLLPNQRLAVRGAKQIMKLALADRGELRAEWVRGLVPELRAAGCSDALLVSAAQNPSRYHVIAEDVPDKLPTLAPPRPKPRSTFFVDNTGCSDAVDVWIDGLHVGQVAPGRRSALVADGGARTLCLLGPGAAQCGDRGTVREVYLHDGWSVTMHCPK